MSVWGNNMEYKAEQMNIVILEGATQKGMGKKRINVLWKVLSRLDTVMLQTKRTVDTALCYKSVFKGGWLNKCGNTLWVMRGRCVKGDWGRSSEGREYHRFPSSIHSMKYSTGLTN